MEVFDSSLLRYPTHGKSRSKFQTKGETYIMKIEISNSKMKTPIGVKTSLEQMMEYLVDEQIYNLGVEICKGLEQATGERIPDWSGAFQTISDIAEGYLFNTLDKEIYFNLLGQTSNSLSYYQLDEIISQAAERLGYVS